MVRGVGETVPGYHTGRRRPFVIEYEADPDDPTPVVAEAANAVLRLGGVDE